MARLPKGWHRIELDKKAYQLFQADEELLEALKKLTKKIECYTCAPEIQVLSSQVEKIIAKAEGRI